MVLFALVLQTSLVVSVSFLKCCRCRADVFHGGASTLHGNACLLNNILHEALSSQRRLQGCIAAIVAFDVCSHFGCTALADLHCGPVEDFMQGVVPCDCPLACSLFELRCPDGYPCCLT